VRTSVLPLGGRVTLHAWRALLDDPQFSDAVAFTLRTAALSTLLAALVALAVALAARGSSTRVRAVLALPAPSRIGWSQASRSCGWHRAAWPSDSSVGTGSATRPLRRLASRRPNAFAG